MEITDPNHPAYGKCLAKKRGHKCVMHYNHVKEERDTHVCMCGEKWEEVRT